MKILMVEDNQGDAVLFNEALESVGKEFEFSNVIDGEEAVALLKGLVDPPDLILLDLNLPKMSGIEVLEAIRSDDRLEAIPVVVFSSSQDPGDIERAYNHRCNAYIMKPSSFNEYSKIANAILRFWGQRG
jgi:CheY-like chemotaxis protein